MEIIARNVLIIIYLNKWYFEFLFFFLQKVFFTRKTKKINKTIFLCTKIFSGLISWLMPNWNKCSLAEKGIFKLIITDLLAQLSWIGNFDGSYWNIEKSKVRKTRWPNAHKFLISKIVVSWKMTLNFGFSRDERKTWKSFILEKYFIIGILYNIQL